MRGKGVGSCNACSLVGAVLLHCSSTLPYLSQLPVKRDGLLLNVFFCIFSLSVGQAISRELLSMGWLSGLSPCYQSRCAANSACLHLTTWRGFFTWQYKVFLHFTACVSSLDSKHLGKVFYPNISLPSLPDISMQHLEVLCLVYVLFFK